MLNEKVDFQFMNIFLAVCCVVFLVVMWGGFYFFVRFKRRDDAKRKQFQEIHGPDSSSEPKS